MRRKNVTAFYNAPIKRKARVQHVCIYCAEKIEIGENYSYQSGNYDGGWFENKMHVECWEEMISSGEFEFLPYSNERPRKEPL